MDSACQATRVTQRQVSRKEAVPLGPWSPPPAAPAAELDYSQTPAPFPVEIWDSPWPKTACLHVSARAGALLDDQTRVRALQFDRWIDHPRATQALQQLERLLAMPERQRMPCMVLHGHALRALAHCDTDRGCG
jgi:hypothetical protein